MSDSNSDGASSSDYSDGSGVGIFFDFFAGMVVENDFILIKLMIYLLILFGDLEC